MFDKLPTSAFELVLDLLNDEDIPPFHLVSKSIFSRVYEYIRHGRENSRRERERSIIELYGDNYLRAPISVISARHHYVRRLHVNLKPRFYRLALIVGRVLPREGVILIDAYKEVLNYSIWRKLFEIKDYNYIHYDEMTFDFEEIQKFYRRNISYRELFDRRNPPPSYKITKRKSELDLKIPTRKKAFR